MLESVLGHRPEEVGWEELAKSAETTGMKEPGFQVVCVLDETASDVATGSEAGEKGWNLRSL